MQPAGASASPIQPIIRRRCVISAAMGLPAARSAPGVPSS
jgi:hypothetical protein